MTKVELTPAFLIHRRAFKDSSLLLDFFTKKYGKIRLVGRSLRKSKTSLQVFQQIKISFFGKNELKTLTDWEIDDHPRNLRGETLILGIYVNELIVRLLQNQDPHNKLFVIYQKFISQIVDAEEQYWLLRLFENDLLLELGYGLDFKNDINGNKIDENLNYKYHHQSGFVCSSTGKISGNTIQLMLAKNVLKQPEIDQLKICRNLNRERLQLLLGAKPLQSRALFWSKN